LDANQKSFILPEDLKGATDLMKGIRKMKKLKADPLVDPSL
jgi:hypothetical protein